MIRKVSLGRDLQEVKEEPGRSMGKDHSRQGQSKARVPEVGVVLSSFKEARGQRSGSR